MGNIKISARIPIYIDIDVDMEDDDLEHLISEWDKANFGIVKAILEKYIDLEDQALLSGSERFGEVEVTNISLDNKSVFEKVKKMN